MCAEWTVRSLSAVRKTQPSCNLGWVKSAEVDFTLKGYLV